MEAILLETIATATVLSFVMTLMYKLMLSWMMGELEKPETDANHFLSIQLKDGK